MSTIVDTREYVDGDNRLNACIHDNGCVSFATCTKENNALGPRAGVRACRREAIDHDESQDVRLTNMRAC